MTLRLIGARAVQEATRPLAEQFTQRTGHAVEHSYSPVGTVRKRLADGEQHDIVIVSASAIDEMAGEGVVDGATRIVLGSTSIGMCVRAGAACPDIGTAEAFRQTVIAAGSVALSDLAVGGTAGTYLNGLFERIGLSEVINAKAKRCAGGVDVAKCVAAGDAEIGFTFISEILPVKGAAVVGPLPAPYGNTTVYVAAVRTGSAQAEPARALIRAFVDPSARDLWREVGFENG